MRSRRILSSTQAFTLIELLIVVAIIAILAAIAVPNFLEAQMRAKVGRVKTDMRSISIALESYSVDTNGKLPPLMGMAEHTTNSIDRGGIFNCWALSTPIAYLSTTRIPDPFVKSQAYDALGIVPDTNVNSFTINYVNVPLYRQRSGLIMDNRPRYFLLSLGPDFLKGPNPFTGAAATLNDYGRGDWPQDPAHLFQAWEYDPSNGSISGGEIIRRP